MFRATKVAAFPSKLENFPACKLHSIQLLALQWSSSRVSTYDLTRVLHRKLSFSVELSKLNHYTAHATSGDIFQIPERWRHSCVLLNPRRAQVLSAWLTCELAYVLTQLPLFLRLPLEVCGVCVGCVSLIISLRLPYVWRHDYPKSVHELRSRSPVLRRKTSLQMFLPFIIMLCVPTTFQVMWCFRFVVSWRWFL